MRTLYFSLITVMVLALATEATAQDEYGDAESGQSGSTYAAPAAKASVSSNAGMGGDYPAFSLGARLEFMALDPSFAVTAPAYFEATLRITSRFSAYALLGFYNYRKRVFVDESGEDDDLTRIGILLLGLGARFNFWEPEVSHAHLYVGADVIFGIGIATVKDDGDSDSESEDDLREVNDRFISGAALGIEYMFSEDFSIAPEIGARMMINSLKDNNAASAVKRDYEAVFGTSFALRMTYHF